jgi:hypothetical protein
MSQDGSPYLHTVCLETVPLLCILHIFSKGCLWFSSIVSCLEIGIRWTYVPVLVIIWQIAHAGPGISYSTSRGAKLIASARLLAPAVKVLKLSLLVMPLYRLLCDFSQRDGSCLQRQFTRTGF